MDDLNLVSQIFLFLGIDVTDAKERTNFKKIVRLLPKICFPLFLHLNVIIYAFILHGPAFDITFDIMYGRFLDFLMISIPCALWWSVYIHKNSITFLIQKVLHSKKKCENAREFSNLIIVISIIYWLFLILFMAVTAAFREGDSCSVEINSNTTKDKAVENMTDENTCNTTTSVSFKSNVFIKELIQFIQQLLLHFLFAILYMTIGCNLIKCLKFYQNKLSQLHESNGEQPLRMDLQEYLSVLKSAETFAEIFSIPTFFFILQMILQLCIYCLDFLIIKTFHAFLIAHAIMTIISLIVLTIVFSFFAAEIPLKIAKVKMVLNDVVADQLLQNVSNNKEMIEALLSRETVSVSACNMFSINRSFFLKAMTAVIVYSLIYYHASEM